MVAPDVEVTAHLDAVPIVLLPAVQRVRDAEVLVELHVRAVRDVVIVQVAMGLVLVDVKDAVAVEVAVLLVVWVTVIVAVMVARTIAKVIAQVVVEQVA